MLNARRQINRLPENGAMETDFLGNVYTRRREIDRRITEVGCPSLGQVKHVEAFEGHFLFVALLFNFYSLTSEQVYPQLCGESRNC